MENGNIYVAWVDDRDGEDKIYFNMFNSTTGKWNKSDIKVNDQTSNGALPDIAVKNSKIYIIFGYDNGGLWGGYALSVLGKLWRSGLLKTLNLSHR